MIARTRFRQVSQGLLLHLAALALIGYFAFHAYHGNYGLNARKGYEADIERLTRQRDDLRNEREEWSRRVALLRPQSIDPDTVEELARRDLGFAYPNDLVKLNPGR
ncbi:MAG TPA: septum formation initiator family protein [Xanthobacteraceae bacterium]|jgi:cell division protein FtsB|nr:septum formation initiator family protein [Xanthobacteraceae bacterium]